MITTAVSSIAFIVFLLLRLLTECSHAFTAEMRARVGFSAVTIAWDVNRKNIELLAD